MALFIKMKFNRKNYIGQQKKQPTSWEPVEKWYRKIVGDEGHYYHQHLIIPSLLRLLDLKPDDKLLDLACGDGILGRHIKENVRYLGVDIAPSFIKAAILQDPSKRHEYITSDVTKPLPKQEELFTHATLVLALQNIEFPDQAFKNAANHLKKGAPFIIVMNHPCFRIPRQSAWQIDEAKKLQYRRIDRYYTPMQIPIAAHPSQGETSACTLSFHHPISYYVHCLKSAGFYVADMEEWCSNKMSTGKAAKMENMSRNEFPLFLTIIAEKK